MSSPTQEAKCADTKDAKNPTGACPFKKYEMGIIPVRYAFDDNNEKGKPLNPFPDSDSQWKGRFSPEHRSYTLRQLRDGWLYVYDETDKTFHEYQVEGNQFTKINWSNDDADKPAYERGSKGEIKSCLVYPANNTIYMTFAHQRWTWRLCEHMRSHKPNRSIWMRKIDLRQFQFTQQYPHAGFSAELSKYVADISNDTLPDEMFESTCTPLKPIDSQVEGYRHVSDKPSCTDVDYKADLPAQDSGMFVALDDPLADVTDLFLSLSEEVILRSTLHEDEDSLHKLQMAELTRTLGRVRLESADLPDRIKDDPIKVLEFERQLTDYLFTQDLADKERTALASNPNVGNVPFTQLQEEALEKRSKLQEHYGITPTIKQQKAWQRSTVFSDEVNWTELDDFLTQHYNQLKGIDEKISALYQDFMTAFKQLGTDPLVVGLDNQDETHLSYLLSLTSQYLAVVKQAVNTEEELERLNESLSLDSPKTLFAIASLGFKLENWKAIDTYVEELKNTLLSLDSKGDIVAVSGAIANWGEFTGDSRIQDKAWFKALSTPVQLSFAALQKAVSGKAEQSWRAISNLLFPSQMKTTNSPLGLVSNLRLVILEALVNQDTILAHNPDFAKQYAAWQKKLWMQTDIARRISEIKDGSVTPANHQLQNLQSAQRKIQTLLSSELPMIVMLKHEAVNNTAKQMLNDAIAHSWQYGQHGKKVAQASWRSLGKMGGVVAVLNLWNTSFVLQDIRYKAEQHPNSSLWANPAIREAAYATGYAVSAVIALWRDAKWETIAKGSELLNKSLSRAITTSNASEVATLKTFAKTTAAVSLFGLIATGLETWESWDKVQDSSHSPMERFGYGLKGLSTGTQALVFFAQFTFNISSRLGVASIGAIIAPWMAVTLMIASIVYLIGVVIINAFKRSDLEKWMLHSTWGKRSKQWEKIEELTRLERIINKPQVKLNAVANRRPSQWLDPGSEQWQLELTLPVFTQGARIGLQITRIPKVNKFQYGAADLKTPVLINEQAGVWVKDEQGNPIYRLNLSGTTQDTVAVLVVMPFNWHASEDQQLGYLASGNSQGDLNVKPASKQFATRTIEVRAE